jgi:hypothetical protein
MHRKFETPKRSHFHIHWSRKNQADRECFNSRSEAVERALDLAMMGALFTINQCYLACPATKLSVHQVIKIKSRTENQPSR